jgi:broad specificity phosphatase PhoE
MKMQYPKYLAAIAPLLLASMLGACATRAQQPTGVTFVVVRHAEKADDGSKDPPLTDAGLARAQALGTALRDAPLHAVYATAYRRTQQTAAPSARMRALPVVTYDAKRAASDFVAQLRRDHTSGTVLVVGHSNTAPDIAAALCQCAVPAMGDNEYDRWISIHVDGNGGATLKEERY